MPAPATVLDPDIPNGTKPQGTHGQHSSGHVTAPDMTRPLPPMPHSDADSYDIPSLRRKPVLTRSTSSQQHGRSFSHPFPSLFGGKKSEKKAAPRNVANSKTPAEDDKRGSAAPFLKTPSSLPATIKGPNSGKELVTGKCMTCDTTVRWPQGLKVYRCTTCLTINDLEPYVTPQVDASSAQNVSQKPSSLSLERTRHIIGYCLSQYLNARLHQGEISIAAPEAEMSDLDNSTTTWPQTFYEAESPPSSPRPVLKTRSTSDPALTPVRSRRLEVDQSLAIPSSSAQRRAGRPTSSRENATDRDGASGPPNTAIASGHIFGLLESYIAGSLTGCDALNSSFFSGNAGKDPKAIPVTQELRKQPASETTTPTYESDGFLSELDAKTLLIGDFAENGSWWTGGRPQNDKAAPRQRERSPDGGKGNFSIKSPRVSWSELGEWYRLIINAGESWRRRWRDLRQGLSESQEQIWKDTSLEDLQREITDAQIHLQRSFLKSIENLLKRPRRPLKHPDDCRFLLMLSFNPLLYSPDSVPSTPAVLNSSGVNRSTVELTRTSPSKRLPNRPRKQGSHGHHSGIVKRILGLLANLPSEVHQVLVSWFSRFSDHHFQRVVELVSGFVTYRLSRQQRRPALEQVNPTAGLVPSFTESGIRHASQLHAALEIRSSSTSAKSPDGNPKLSSYGEDWQIRVAAKVMSLLFQANFGHTSRRRDLPGTSEQRLMNAGLNAKYQAHYHGQIIPVSTFYNSMLDYADLIADFDAWEKTKTKFTFCQYPFFLSIYAKIHILEHDARRQMEDKAREAFFDSILSNKTVSQYLVLKVRRDCLVEDSLRSVSEVVGASGGDIKKGLKIDFVGEEGIDAGGLRKEWFLLLTREIFDPNHGLFIYDEDSHYCYFNPFCFESSEQFFLVGVLLGLAIYNSTILDVAFPPFVFKKMLASAPPIGDKLTSTPRIGHGYTLEDLAELRPTLAKGLRQLLEFDGDVEETFCRDFVAEMNKYGEIIQVPLCPGGEKRAVTNTNRKDFVDLYTHYLLDTAVIRQYEPFKRGFFTVCGGNALSLFRPEEIELLVRGSDEPLDINSLRGVATYDGWPKELGPPEQQPQVVWFWDFFHRISPTNQRKMLSFITGSDRIPAMGATNLNIRISCLKVDARDIQSKKWPNPAESGDDIERFPIARTCFNMLSLYQYKSREQLEQKLWMAVACSEGFGLK